MTCRFTYVVGFQLLINYSFAEDKMSESHAKTETGATDKKEEMTKTSGSEEKPQNEEEEIGKKCNDTFFKFAVMLYNPTSQATKEKLSEKFVRTSLKNAN